MKTFSPIGAQRKGFQNLSPLLGIGKDEGGVPALKSSAVGLQIAIPISRVQRSLRFLARAKKMLKIGPLQTNNIHMFRHLIVLNNLILFLDLSGQSYRPLLESTASWFDTYNLASPFSSISTLECYKYYLQGDTTINGVYHAFLRRDGTYRIDNQVSSITQTYSGTIVGFVREDTVARKVFIIEAGSDEEQLMYDFSVDTGSYPWTFVLPSVDLEVTSIDTVQLSNGAYRRIILNESLYIIEGIGATTTGFFKTQSSVPQGYGGMVCHSIAGMTSFLNPVLDSSQCPCDFNLNVANNDHKFISVFPSPTKDIVQLRGAEPITPIIIRSPDGRQIDHLVTSWEGSAIIDLTTHLAGIYLIEMISSHGRQSRIVIKE